MFGKSTAIKGIDRFKASIEVDSSCDNKDNPPNLCWPSIMAAQSSASMCPKQDPLDLGTNFQKERVESKTGGIRDVSSVE
jgi:hypothetical protein